MVASRIQWNGSPVSRCRVVAYGELLPATDEGSGALTTKILQRDLTTTQRTWIGEQARLTSSTFLAIVREQTKAVAVLCDMD
jgi:hypothetical protein